MRGFQNLPLYLAHWAATRPDSEALFVVARKPYSLTYDQLAGRVAAVSAVLSEMDIQAGDRVGVLCNLDDRLCIAMLAIASLGAISMPIIMATPASRHSLQSYYKVHPLKLVLRTRRFEGFLNELFAMEDRPRQLDIDHLMSSAQNLDDSIFATWQGRLQVHPSSSIFYVNSTSGSTSDPKLIEATTGDILANAAVCIQSFDMNSTSRLACMFGLHYHEHFTRPLMIGGCAVLSPAGFLGQSIARACHSSRATHLMLNPHSAEQFLREHHRYLEILRGQLRRIEIGGGTVMPETLRRLNELTGADCRTAYGSTETNGEALVAIDPSQPKWLTPLPGYQVFVVDYNGREVADGKVGELVIAGIIANEYVVTPPGQVRLDGCRFFTLDLAARRGNEVCVLGRCDNAVKMLGMRQPLEPLEQQISAALGIHAGEIQLLDVEPTPLARLCGLSASLLLLVRLVQADNTQNIAVQAIMARKAIRNAKLDGLLSQPCYFLLAEPNEIERVAGKLRRHHARERFPFALHDWSLKDVSRLHTVSLSMTSLFRAIRRLGAQRGALESPVRFLCHMLANGLGKFMRRTIARMGIGARKQ